MIRESSTNLLKVTSLLTALIGEIKFLSGKSFLRHKYYQEQIKLLEERNIHLEKEVQELKQHLGCCREAIARNASRKLEILADRATELELLNALAITVSRSLELSTILSDALRGIAKIFPVSQVEIVVFDDESENISLKVNQKFSYQFSKGKKATTLVSHQLLHRLKTEASSLVIDFSSYKPKFQSLNLNSNPNSSATWTSKQSIFAFPLRSKQLGVGSLLIKGNQNTSWSIKDFKLLSSIGAILGPPVENSKLYKRIRKLSNTDPITGLFNHRFIISKLRGEIKRASRYRHRLATIMLDIDNFKPINDQFGHLVGDRALHQVALAIVSACRATDFVGRYGGDEFLVVLPETNTTQARRVAERILKHISQLEIKTLSNKPIGRRLTASIGVSAYPNNGLTTSELISQADKCLYISKRNGGNKMIVNKYEAAKTVSQSQSF
jgi:diguanylate cyclase (GGDEF)-like protein